MGNLGLYLWLTRAAKKLGGPVAFVVALVLGGGLMCIGLEQAIIAIVKAIKKRKKNLESEPVYTVGKDAVSEDGMAFAAGDQFRVLMRDGDYALIERIRDEEHHILPVSFISGISDYVLA